MSSLVVDERPWAGKDKEIRPVLGLLLHLYGTPKRYLLISSRRTQASGRASVYR